ncbi:dihydromethanopterin reductase (acceptor) [Methanocella arvoryzae]|uniref:2(4Fe-4S) ferredoxin-domain protein n=1 Tax=Methanocella arvoryzae (strain DSM 22066 / NBRC 105507 / MRE50) TaxID=351160 RepID=Q0W1C1_METAR|nr:dihydromethanopterin reductase (acceptor) [Methanocella arvoryzae]CAJ37822.1 2(4Fe-4S) ferredoxin-domain protein [Methanocella arvoryzae MRE50]
MKKLRIAWGITGAGHYLRESYAVMGELKKEGHSITTFVSRAGEEVSRMYGLFDDLKEISDGTYLNEIFLDSAQGASFPKIGRFNLKRYDLFVLTPATSNTVAKIVFGIADTLVTNCAAQAMKSDVPCLIVPVDQESDVVSELPYTLDRSRCESCAECPPKAACPGEAIQDHIDLLKCQGCGTCVDLCLHGAISGGDPVPLTIRQVDARNTRMLAEMEHVQVISRPKRLLETVRKM